MSQVDWSRFHPPIELDPVSHQACPKNKAIGSAYVCTSELGFESVHVSLALQEVVEAVQVQ